MSGEQGRQREGRSDGPPATTQTAGPQNATPPTSLPLRPARVAQKGMTGEQADVPASTTAAGSEGQNSRNKVQYIQPSAPAMAVTSHPDGPVSSGGLSTPHSPSGLYHPPLSPQRSRHFSQAPSSPCSTSQLPNRAQSPASSQIFERDVQEDILSGQPSAAIPTHIITENHIPPVLEASSAAITDQRLDPDEVEIITHTIHQPAAAAVAGPMVPEQSPHQSFHEDHVVPPGDVEEASTYGAVDTTDVRRLSFISFADVINAEHAEHAEGNKYPTTARDALQTTGLAHRAAIAATPVANRSPSPLRSPASSHGLGTSPPTSVSMSFKGPEASPNRKGHGAGSPLPSAYSPVSMNFGGELSVETMREALRRTKSGDLTTVKSRTSGHIGEEEDH